MFTMFYDNRRLLVLAIALILVGGLSSFTVLPRMEDPVLTQRAAIINTRFPGASSERVETLVTEKIEQELQEIEEIKELRSSSRSGISTITVELKDRVTEVDEVWSRIRDKLDDARPLLPEQAGKPHFDQLEVSAYAAIVALVWDLEGEPNQAVLRRLTKSLEDRLRTIPGTRDVNTYGAPREEILVEIRHHDLVALGLSVAEVTGQLQSSDAKVSAGLFRSPTDILVIEVDTELDSLERIRQTPIALGSGGRFVPLGNLAHVSKGVEQPTRSLALVDGKPAIALGAFVQGRWRVDYWTAMLEQELAEFSADLPAGIRLTTVFWQNDYVETRLQSLLMNLLLGASAVVGVIWLMMGWRSALVVGLALPLASLMVLTGMRVLGVPMHQMSITGLIIALGLLIDNAIVMVDEVRGRVLEGMSPRDAVGQSVRHLAVPLTGSTVTTALSFAPIALMPGPAGEFVGSIAISVILAVASSLLLALTVTPSIMGILESRLRENATRRWWTHGLSSPAGLTLYRRALDAIFSRPWWGIVLGVTLPFGGFVAARTLTEQFFPPADRNQFQIQLTMPAQASLNRTAEVALAVRKQLLQHAEVRRVEWLVGSSAPSFYYNMLANREETPQFAQALVEVTERAELVPLIRQLQEELSRGFPEARLLVRQLEQGPPFEAPVEMRLYGPDLEVLRHLGDEVRAVLAGTPDVVHTAANLSEVLPKLAVQVDEEQARLAGLDHQRVAQQLDFALEGTVGGSVLEATEELPVRVRVSDLDRGLLGQIASLDVIGQAAGRPVRVPLSTLAQPALVPEVSVVQRMNTQRMNEVQAYIAAGVLPAKVLHDFRDRLERSGFQLPRGYHVEWGGEASKRDDAIGNLMSNISVLVVMMVATLVLSFSSFRMAALIGSVAMLSVGLSLGAIAAFGYPFGFMAIVGTMGLIGVAINDSIVVLAALREDPRASQGDLTAIREVVVRATRHVLSTTLTTVAGFLPLLLGGGGFWPPLATAIAGGVAGATLLALIFVPSTYALLVRRDAATVEPVPTHDLACPAEMPGTLTQWAGSHSG
jgi:multidrug efflux pump subunit AcrB